LARSPPLESHTGGSSCSQSFLKKAGATYVATVSTGTRDLAGNQLDQDPNTAGNQARSWQFKVKP